MINFNENLTQDQARYIIEEVLSKRGYRIDRTTLGWFEKAHNLAFKEQVGQPSCSCEMIATYNVWNSRLSQYEQQIRAIAYPVIEILPSEIIVEAVTEIQTLPNEIKVKTTKGRPKK
jgi:hypothetical protein